LCFVYWVEYDLWVVVVEVWEFDVVAARTALAGGAAVLLVGVFVEY